MTVSVIVPTFKRPDYLKRLLESLVNQTYKKFEVIVIDDNSPNYNSYLDVVKEYETKFDLFTFLRNEKNRGACHSRNRGIDISKYDILCFVDDDDEWHPQKLEKQVDFFKRNALDICSTWAKVVNDQREILTVNHLSPNSNSKIEILKECFICSPSVMVSKQSIINAGMFDEEFPSCQDWDMWTRVIFNGAKYDILREELVNYYKHENTSIGKSSKSKIGYLYYYRKHLLKLIFHFQIRHLYRYFIWSLKNISS